MESLSDRELLELAAKAAGIELRKWSDAWAREPGEEGFQTEDYSRWNPLTDDSDALRLAVKLGIAVGPSTGRPDYCIAEGRSRRGMTPYFMEAYGCDPACATRRAIVRAAAAIGASMQ